ncbi:MAG TPA: glycosyltransferase family 87 protein [Candidatus Limnocylindrales bacterium]|nr:glycosyltransferase family 87 protein [Candidatus Limnocylindrales bacterium]
MDLRRLAAAALPIVAILTLVVVTGSAAFASAQVGTLGFDFLSYDLAVRRFFDGGILYDQSFDYTGAFGLFYYPPPFVLLAAPLSVLEPALAAWIFTAILLLTYVLAVAILPVSRTIRWGMLLLGGLSWPLVYAIKLGQVGPILLLTFAIGWRWMDRPWRFGAATAVGTAIKIQPALLFGWALLAGRRRAVVIGLAVLAVLALAATIVAGPSSWVDQATLLARVSKPIDTPHNFTPGRLAFEAGAGQALAWAVQIANWVAIAVVVIWATLRCAPVASYLAVVIASQLISPILWDHYALMLLLPVAWLVSRGHWWSVVIPLVTAVPLTGTTPPIADPLAYWVTLVAVVVEGRRLARAGAAGQLSLQPVPEPGAILNR